MKQRPASSIPWWKRSALRRGLAAFVTLVLLVCLYRAADWREVLAALGNLRPGYLAAALLLFIPQTVASAWRWQALVAPRCRISLGEAVRQTLAASALNLALPSKLGDFSKAAMLPVGRSSERLGLAARVTAEKLADVAALALLLVAGWLGAGMGTLAVLLAFVWLMYAALLWSSRRTGFPARPSTDIAREDCQSRESRAARAGRPAQKPVLRDVSWWSLVPGSITLWCLHLAQLHLFLWAAGVEVSLTETLARVPLAIFAGLIPVAVMGIGTRDAALVWLFAGFAPASTMAAVGLLTALRYLVPGAAGIPLLAGVWRTQPVQPAGASAG